MSNSHTKEIDINTENLDTNICSKEKTVSKFDTTLEKELLEKSYKNVVFVAHAVEKVKRDSNTVNKKIIRFSEDTFKEPSGFVTAPDKERKEIINTKPVFEAESVTNICWWSDCYPDQCCDWDAYDPDLWNCYLRIALAVLFIALMATAAIIFILTTTPAVSKYLQNHFLFFVLVTVISIVMLNYYILCFVSGQCCYSLSYIVLTFVVISYALLLSALSARLETEAFLYAALTTASVSVVLMGLTFLPCVISYALLLSALSARLETEAFLYAALTTASVSVVLMGLTFLPCFCFSRWPVVLPVAISTALSSFFFVHLFLSNFYAKSYPSRHLLLILIMVLLNAVVLVFEIRRLLCSNCIQSMDPCWYDYGLGAYLLYTMFLQIVFYWLYLVFSCMRWHYMCF